MCFHGGITKTLNAMSHREAKRWYKCIEERRLWFRDITTAAESREKLKQAQERQQFEIKQQVEEMSAPVGVSVGEKEPESESESESEQEDLDFMEKTAPVVGEIPIGGVGIEKRDGVVDKRRLSQFDPFADDGDDTQEASTPGTGNTDTTTTTRRLSQFDPFGMEEEEAKTKEAPSIRASPPSYDSSMKKKEEQVAFDPFASSTAPVRQSSFDPFADIPPAKSTTADPFASLPIASTNSAGSQIAEFITNLLIHHNHNFLWLSFLRFFPNELGKFLFQVFL